MDDEWDEGRERLIGNREVRRYIFFVRNRELFVVVVGRMGQRLGDIVTGIGSEVVGLGRLAVLR